MNDAPAKEWQCPKCGSWVSASWWRHGHVQQKEASMEEMLRARFRGDLDPVGAAETLCDTYMRTGKEPTRTVENGC